MGKGDPRISEPDWHTVATVSKLLQACVMECSACQSEIPLAAGETVGFRDSCDRCHADLRACTNCTHHDASAYNECREPSAERILDRERANRCEWFRPASASASAEEAQQAALSGLEALFKKS